MCPSNWKMYMEVVRHTITTDPQSFWLLSITSSTERPEGLPTWAPNLNSPIPEINDFSLQNWHAGVLRDSPPRSGISLIPDSPDIKVSGFVIEKVQEVVTFMPLSDVQGELSLEDLAIRCLDWNKRCWRHSKGTYSGTKEALDAYLRTLIINIRVDVSPVLPF